MPDSSGAVDLNSISPEEKEQVERLAEERGGEQPSPEEDHRQKVLTAFLVVVGYDGNPQVLRINDPNLLVQSEPTPDLVYGAASTILKDLEAQETAQAAAAMTVQAMMEQSRAMMEQQMAAQAGLPGSVDLGKLRDRRG